MSSSRKPPRPRKQPLVGSREPERATPKRRALLSVADKEGLAPFAAGLEELNFEIISTGGTAEVLRSAGIDC